jgi:hypothetical protein
VRDIVIRVQLDKDTICFAVLANLTTELSGTSLPAPGDSDESMPGTAWNFKSAQTFALPPSGKKMAPGIWVR